MKMLSKEIGDIVDRFDRKLTDIVRATDGVGRTMDNRLRNLERGFPKDKLQTRLYIANKDEYEIGTLPFDRSNDIYLYEVQGYFSMNRVEYLAQPPMGFHAKADQGGSQQTGNLLDTRASIANLVITDTLSPGVRSSSSGQLDFVPNTIYGQKMWEIIYSGDYEDSNGLLEAYCTIKFEVPLFLPWSSPAVFFHPFLNMWGSQFSGEPQSFKTTVRFLEAETVTAKALARVPQGNP